MYEKFMNLELDLSLLCLEQCDNQPEYFCYPIGAQPIGYEGSIMYCFLEGYGEMVFAVNPESCADIFVYPLARDFIDFLRLILACGTVNPAEQIVWMSKEQFEAHVREEATIRKSELIKALERISKEFGLEAMEEPYEYVKSLQVEFDSSQIQYSDEYYDVLGIARDGLEELEEDMINCIAADVSVCVTWEE